MADPLLMANIVKGAASGLKKYLATESHLKMIKNVFYFILKAFFVFDMFKFFC